LHGGEHLLIRIPPRFGCGLVAIGVLWAGWLWFIAASALYGPLSRAVRGAGGPSPLGLLASAALPVALALIVLLQMAGGFFRRYELAVHGGVLTVLDAGLFYESRRQWRRDEIDRIVVRSGFLGATLFVLPWRGTRRRLPGRVGLFGQTRLATREEWEWVAALLRRALDRTAGSAAPAESGGARSQERP
jgi:hypothetical protein